MWSRPFTESSSRAPPSSLAAGVSHRMSLDETTCDTSSPTVLFVNKQRVPSSRLASAEKWSPCTAMVVPPTEGPVLGETTYADGGATYWNCKPLSVKSCRFTETSTLISPARSEGDAHTIVVAVRSRANTGVAPKRHVARPVVGKFAPVKVTRVPPETAPRVGYAAVTFGGSA